MFRPPRGDDAPWRRLSTRRSRQLLSVRVFEHPSNRRRAEMEPRSAQDVGDPPCAHRGEQCLEATHKVADELGVLVHDYRHLDERVGTFLVEPLSPVSDRERAYEKARGGLCLWPSAGGARLEARKPLRGR